MAAKRGGGGVAPPKDEKSDGSNAVRLSFAPDKWREREGVEPTVDTVGCPPTDLKSARPTGAHPLPWRERPGSLVAPGRAKAQRANHALNAC